MALRSIVTSHPGEDRFSALVLSELRKLPPCTSAGSNRAHPVRILSKVTNCALFGGFSPSHPSCPHLSVVHPSVPPGLPAWLSARARRPNCPSRRILTCCATPTRFKDFWRK